MQEPFPKIMKYALDLIARWASHPDDFSHRERYLAYLEACGWTDKEFDRYLLMMVDSGWESTPVMPLWLN